MRVAEGGGDSDDRQRTETTTSSSDGGGGGGGNREESLASALAKLKRSHRVYSYSTQSQSTDTADGITRRASDELRGMSSGGEVRDATGVRTSAPFAEMCALVRSRWSEVMGTAVGDNWRQLYLTGEGIDDFEMRSLFRRVLTITQQQVW